MGEREIQKKMEVVLLVFDPTDKRKVAHSKVVGRDNRTNHGTETLA